MGLCLLGVLRVGPFEQSTSLHTLLFDHFLTSVPEHIRSMLQLNNFTSDSYPYTSKYLLRARGFSGGIISTRLRTELASREQSC